MFWKTIIKCKGIPQLFFLIGALRMYRSKIMLKNLAEVHRVDDYLCKNATPLLSLPGKPLTEIA